MTPRLSRRRLLQGSAALGLSSAFGRRAGRLSAASGSPVTVIHNGRVFIGTADNAIAEALAVGADGTILGVGTSADIRSLVGTATNVIDANGATVMAGIHDGHIHPVAAAEAALSPSLGNVDMTVPEFQAALTAMLDATADEEPDGWLTVNDWSPVGLLPAGTVAHRSMLDALPTRRPIYVQGSDHHNALVNTRALEIAGIDAATPNPSGGEIVRDADGSATGLLKDAAQDLVLAVIPPPSEEQLARARVDGFRLMAANGITSFLDAYVDESFLQKYVDISDRGALLQRVVPALVLSADLAATPADAVAYVTDLEARFGDVTNLRFGTAKIFADGVIEFPAQTAALLEPYLDADGNPTDNLGDLYVEGPAMDAVVTALDAAGWQVHIHAIGDRAVRVALDGFAAAQSANGDSDRRHTIAHLQLVHPDDYPRFSTTQTVACMQLQWATRNSFTLDALRPYIGEERWARMYPARSMQEVGAFLSGGSDWPVDPLNPFNQIETAITRVGEYASEPEPLGADQAIDRFDVLRMHTAASAYQIHCDDSGTLEAGKRADLVVLDRDITTSPEDEIKGTTVRYTLINGEVVHDAESSSATSTTAGFAIRAGRRSHPGLHRHAACCGGGRR